MVNPKMVRLVLKISIGQNQLDLFFLYFHLLDLLHLLPELCYHQMPPVVI